jgi:diguanylate cyclase (GGDEF)-like protein
VDSITLEDLKIAILQELRQAGTHLNKFNLLGGRNPGQRGPLEHRLQISFDKDVRALAGQAFEELKKEGLIRPTYADLVDPENWVEITEAGCEALKTGLPQADIGIAVADSLSSPGLSKFGIPDHQSFLDRIRSMEVPPGPVSALFLDLDNFKAVNDTHDHSTGDLVIRDAIATIQKAIQGKGELFHRSGDEMIVLLPNFDQDEAQSVAERIRHSIETNDFSVVGQGFITATIGVSTYPHSCSVLDHLEITADRAAMEAKQLGKNLTHAAAPLADAAANRRASNPRLSRSARAVMVSLSEELATNLRSVTDAAYGQLGRLLDDQYRRATMEHFYVDLPGELRAQISDAYRTVRNVNDYIQNSMQQEMCTPGGTEARNEVLKAKQESLQPIQAALRQLQQYLRR